MPQSGPRRPAVCLNMVDGRILYENGEFKTLDQEKILYEARSAAARLLA